ncbi:hypothetical protein [Ruixingdingia sedimenti]|uniref:Uncharacterized protein n=1 Tax=Ruixingdingia sedimenti TaxID=3073604 RepID=A0ABU1FF27_9RHOB|nr:hypothetical protein [Xinfangfangia sp. LG-4]MDR5655490.1 hypothetical protein [Xinfangfangia sp. LG-4]
MSAILSREAPEFDLSAKGFRAAAGDLGEVIALMAGGIRPDPETLSRLCDSMRSLQGLLVDLAEVEAEVELMRRGEIQILPVLGEIA